MKFVNSIERDIQSSFNIMSQRLIQFVFLDLVTNDQLFYKYLSVDESYQTKKSFLTIRFYPTPPLKSFSFTLTTQFTDDNKMYLRVKIKGNQTQAGIDELRNVISKLFTYYSNNENRIIEIYKQHGVKPPMAKVNQTKSNKTDGFLKGQSRKCQHQQSAFTTREEAINSKRRR